MRPPERSADVGECPQRRPQPRAQIRIQDALARAPKDIEVLYRSAVISSLSGRPDAAIDFLQKAIAGGYSKSRAVEDDDFAKLRNTSFFKQLVTSNTP